MPTNHDRLLEATREEFERRILGHPLLADVAARDVTKAQYARYLCETYHLVKHTPRFLALTASRFDESQRQLRHYFLTQADDEDGHHLLCYSDLTHLGYDPEALLEAPPGEGSWFLVTQSYYNATQGNPHRNLGLASLTEGMGATIAGGISTQLMDMPFIDRKSTAFLRSHSSFDQRHVQEVADAINDHVHGEENFEEVVHARHMAIRGYARMLTDVLEAHKDGSVDQRSGRTAAA